MNLVWKSTLGLWNYASKPLAVFGPDGCLQLQYDLICCHLIGLDVFRAAGINSTTCAGPLVARRGAGPRSRHKLAETDLIRVWGVFLPTLSKQLTIAPPVSSTLPHRSSFPLPTSAIFCFSLVKCVTNLQCLRRSFHEILHVTSSCSCSSCNELKVHDTFHDNPTEEPLHGLTCSHFHNSRLILW